VLIVVVIQLGTTQSYALVTVTGALILADFLFLSYCNGKQVDYVQRRFIFIRNGLDNSYGAIRRTIKERLPNSFSDEDMGQLRGVLPVAIFIFLLYLVFGVIPRLAVQLLWGITCMLWFFAHWTASTMFMHSKDTQPESTHVHPLAIGIYVIVLYGSLGMMALLLLL
jgi:hypothetical protein